MRRHLTALAIVLAAGCGAHAAEGRFYRQVTPGGGYAATPGGSPGTTPDQAPATPSAPDTATVSLSPSTVREGTAVTGSFSSTIPGATWAKASGPAWLTVAPDGTIGGASGDIDASQAFAFSATATSGTRSATATGSITLAPHTVTLTGVPQSRAVGTAMAGNASSSHGGNVAWSLTGTPPAWMSVSSAGVLQGTAAQPYGSFTFSVKSSVAGITATSDATTLQVNPPVALASGVRPTSLTRSNLGQSPLAPTFIASDTIATAHDGNLSGAIMSYDLSSRASEKYMTASYPTVYANGCYLAAVITPNTSISLATYFSYSDNTGGPYSYSAISDANGLVVLNGACGMGSGKYVTGVNWYVTGYAGNISYVEAKMTYNGVSTP